jgi:hypothetical protein
MWAYNSKAQHSSGTYRFRVETWRGNPLHQRRLRQINSKGALVHSSAGAGPARGRTLQGVAARLSLYTTIELIAERGYEATTLRDVADRARLSVGLL